MCDMIPCAWSVVVVSTRRPRFIFTSSRWGIFYGTERNRNGILPHTRAGSDKLFFTDYGPYPKLRHKIKMAAIGGGLCTESLWGG